MLTSFNLARSWLKQKTVHIPFFQSQRRVPVLLQVSAVECGAACLAMILNYYGRTTKVAECRLQCGVSRDGLTLQAIAQAARQYGLRAKAYTVTNLDDLKYVTLPAIAHWNFDHFIILEHWSTDLITIVDPAGGRRQISYDEFHTNFTGVLLTLEPGLHFRRQNNSSPNVWHTYFARILGFPGTITVLLQILVASLFLQLLGLALPLLTKVIVDTVLPLQMTNIMSMIGLGMAILVITQMVTMYLRATLLVYLQGRLDTQMILGFLEHVLTLPFSFFQQRNSGDLLMRLSSNITLRELITNQSISTILDGAFVLVYLIILLVQASGFGLLVLLIGAIQLLLLWKTTRSVHYFMQQELHAQAKSQNYLVEILSGIDVIKASGVEDKVFDHWSNLFFRHLNLSLQRSHYSAKIDTVLATVRNLSPLVLLWIGALYVLQGRISLGTMLALNALAAAFLTPLTSLVSSGRQLQLASAQLDRLVDVIEAEPEQDTSQANLALSEAGKIELKNVSFRYQPKGKDILHDISFTIFPGQKIAIVGRSGSGKSTLAKLLLALYRPTSGEIYYDALPLAQLNYRMLRQQFGVVMQTPFLFDGSIRQNIALHDPDMSLKQVVQAAQWAAVHEDITQMPMGYETRIAEKGSALSGGQQQRLALARALVRRPRILLLDEATSHLDSATENQIYENLRGLACTQIVIAHRLSTIRNADKVIVLNKGHIDAWGTHEELLNQEGLYSMLVRQQNEYGLTSLKPACL